MIDYEAKLKEIDEHIDKMLPEERARQEAKTKDKPEAIFDLVKKGDVVGVAVAIKLGHKFEQAVVQGQTPLHQAASRDAGVIARLLIDCSPQMLWKKDAEERLPEQRACQAGHGHIEDLLLVRKGQILLGSERFIDRRGIRSEKPARGSWSRSR